MAQKPVFTTAPRLKLYADSRLVAYAVGFSFNVSLDVQPIYVFGSYRPIALERTMISIVTGTMQIQRLISPGTSQDLVNKANVPDNTKDRVASGTLGAQTAFSDVTGTELAGSNPGAGASNVVLNQNNLFRHMDPDQILLSQTFDMQMNMKVPTATNAIAEVGWMQIQKVRFVGRNVNISMGQIVNVPMNFRGLLVTHLGPGNTRFQLDSSSKGS